jgi:hypothetical protein
MFPSLQLLPWKLGQIKRRFWSDKQLPWASASLWRWQIFGFETSFAVNPFGTH